MRRRTKKNGKGEVRYVCYIIINIKIKMHSLLEDSGHFFLFNFLIFHMNHEF